MEAGRIQALVRMLGTLAKEGALGKAWLYCPMKPLTSLSCFLETLMIFACVVETAWTQLLFWGFPCTLVGALQGSRAVLSASPDQICEEIRAGHAVPSSGSMETSLGLVHLQ